MRCSYCFYHSTSSARETPSYGLMGEATAHALIDRAFSHLPSPFSVSFLFQGGEPTLAGLPFFREFIRYAKERLPARCEVRYALQTNGLLIDEDWCAFLKENRFLVGLSLDGDKDVHDLLRIDAAGKGTFSRVLAAAKLFDKIGVDYNILTVVTRTLARRIRAVWNTYQKLGFRYLQFIPCLPPFDGAEEKHALTPALYATFLKESFALWADGIRRGNYVSVRFFDNLVLLLRGMPAEQCGLSGRCRFQFVTEADGGVYPCDFYCLDEFRCGNISADTLIKNLGGRLRMQLVPGFAVYSGYRWSEGKGNDDKWNELVSDLSGKVFTGPSGKDSGTVLLKGMEYGVAFGSSEHMSLVGGYIPQFRTDYGGLGVLNEPAYTAELRFAVKGGAIRLRGLKSDDYWMADFGVTLR
jgi:uncharacterized protein